MIILLQESISLTFSKLIYVYEWYENNLQKYTKFHLKRQNHFFEQTSKNSNVTFFSCGQQKPNLLGPYD